MKLYEVLKNHPKSMEVLKEFYIEKFNKAMSSKVNLPKDFRKTLASSINLIIEKGIDKEPWTLTSMLDKYNIFLTINVIIQDNTPLFFYSIITLEEAIDCSDKQYNTRLECVTEGVIKCIGILEELLDSK